MAQPTYPTVTRLVSEQSSQPYEHEHERERDAPRPLQRYSTENATLLAYTAKGQTMQRALFISARGNYFRVNFTDQYDDVPTLWPCSAESAASNYYEMDVRKIAFETAFPTLKTGIQVIDA
jgi:hypothetical protein